MNVAWELEISGVVGGRSVEERMRGCGLVGVFGGCWARLALVARKSRHFSEPRMPVVEKGKLWGGREGGGGISWWETVGSRLVGLQLVVVVYEC